MKFQKKEAYVNVIQEPPRVGKTDPLLAWDCLMCEEKATVLHRGTAYCRDCYDKRNYNNTLVN